VASIGTRELRRNASRHLCAVEERRETIEITARARRIGATARELGVALPAPGPFGSA